MIHRDMRVLLRHVSRPFSDHINQARDEPLHFGYDILVFAYVGYLHSAKYDGRVVLGVHATWPPFRDHGRQCVGYLILVSRITSPCRHGQR